MTIVKFSKNFFFLKIFSKQTEHLYKTTTIYIEKKCCFHFPV
jgi:hypothetical protein